MKLEDKQRLKRFWQAKVLLVTSAIGVISFSIITNVSVALNLYSSISQSSAIRQYSQICPARSQISTCSVFEGFITISEKLRKEDVKQLLLLEFILIGISFALIIYLLFCSLQIHDLYPISWSGYLPFSEEVIANLIALEYRRQQQNIPRWKIYCELIFCEILPLFWAVHIQIRLQNLSLPANKKRNID
jgi:hypothetical protein